jgi:hypothetical protein
MSSKELVYSIYENSFHRGCVIKKFKRNYFTCLLYKKVYLKKHQRSVLKEQMDQICYITLKPIFLG